MILIIKNMSGHVMLKKSSPSKNLAENQRLTEHAGRISCAGSLLAGLLRGYDLHGVYVHRAARAADREEH